MPENTAVNEQGVSPAKTVIDDQTGRLFLVEPEKPIDTLAATASVIYLLVVLVGFLWLLFDVWVEKFSIFTGLGYADVDMLKKSVMFHLLSYAFIGGGLGGVIGGYCSFSAWHCERRAFGWRFIWKYVSFPWLGGTLALVVYAIMTSGIAVFGGNVGSGQGTPSATQFLFSLSTGALVGYGSPRVMKWLDAQVDRLFKIDAQSQTKPTGESPVLAAADAEQTVDGCDVETVSTNVTADEQLPAAVGGVA